jgi:hypothetical protein
MAIYTNSLKKRSETELALSNQISYNIISCISINNQKWTQILLKSNWLS